MNPIRSQKLPIRVVLASAIVLITLSIASFGFAAGGSSKAKDAKPTAATQHKATETKKQPLTGAELYSVNCNRCHAERYPTEWTSAQWKTLMLHMRVRANLPAAQARKILKYLQEDSGN